MQGLNLSLGFGYWFGRGLWVCQARANKKNPERPLV